MSGQVESFPGKFIIFVLLTENSITMENGEIIPFELYEEDAPGTVANFVKLVKEGYYDGKTFHRVIPGFVSQWLQRRLL